MAGRFDYSKIQGIATGVLTQFAQGTITLEIETPGAGPSYDPGAPSVATHALPGAVAKTIQRPVRLVPGGLAIAGDMEVTSQVLAGVTPKEGNRMVIDGVTHRVVAFAAVPPAGTPVVWKFVVRKG